MRKKWEVACFALVLAALMISLAVPVYGVENEKFDPQAKTLQFLSDVVMLNLSRYEVTLGYDRAEIDPGLGGAVREEVLYNISSADTYCIASCMFTNGAYDYSLIGWNKGTPVYTQPQPSNPTDFAKAVLERFQAFAGSPRYQPLIDMLGGTAAPGFTLQVKVYNSAQIGFRWSYSVEGFETNALTIKILNGDLQGINDAMGIFKVSEAPTAISEQQAISIAVNSASAFSWQADGQEYSVTDPIPVDLARASKILNTLPTGDPFTLYPIWKVMLYLGKTYPGGVKYISAGVWADTGEVSYILAHGDGSASSSEQPVGTSTSTTSPSVTDPSEPGYSQGDDEASPSTSSHSQLGSSASSYSQSNSGTSDSDVDSPPETALSPDQALVQQSEDASAVSDVSASAETSASSPTPLSAFVSVAAVVATIAIAAGTIYARKRRGQAVQRSKNKLS
jgi:hypothetical protein